MPQPANPAPIRVWLHVFDSILKATQREMQTPVEEREKKKEWRKEVHWVNRLGYLTKVEGIPGFCPSCVQHPRQSRGGSSRTRMSSILVRFCKFLIRHWRGTALRSFKERHLSRSRVNHETARRHHTPKTYVNKKLIPQFPLTMPEAGRLRVFYFLFTRRLIY